ncbi:MAG: hypothetical protein R2845_09965 [Thermomicrobiales bacterium]
MILPGYNNDKDWVKNFQATRRCAGSGATGSAVRCGSSIRPNHSNMKRRLLSAKYYNYDLSGSDELPNEWKPDRLDHGDRPD